MCCSVYVQVCFTTSIVTVDATVWKQFQLLLICRLCVVLELVVTFKFLHLKDVIYF